MHLGEDYASYTTNSSTQADAAALYRRHWHSLCAFARAKGCESHDAEDAVQELFAKLVAQGQDLRAAAIEDHGEQGAFLVVRLRTHLIKRWQHRTRQCRGGGTVCFSLSDENGENIDVADTQATPDAELDREWARGVLEGAMQRMSHELHAEGHGDVWGCLEQNISGSGRSEQRQTGALRVALFRARQRLRNLIRDQMCSSSAEDARATLHLALA